MRLRQKQDGPRQGLVRPTRRAMERPVPDEAVLDDSASNPSPQPEHREPSGPDPRLRVVTFSDGKPILIRASKEFMADNAMMLASALAYASFFAIPSVIIVATGLFTLVASPQDITNFMQHITFIPAEAKTLLQSSLTRASNNKGSSLV